MHRTMIYIDESDYQQLEINSEKIGSSVSKIIRKAVRAYLDSLKESTWDLDPVWGLSGIGSANEENTDSKDHDVLLYGKDPS